MTNRKFKKVVAPLALGAVVSTVAGSVVYAEETLTKEQQIESSNQNKEITKPAVDMAKQNVSRRSKTECR